jgi:hypothetical protein
MAVMAFYILRVVERLWGSRKFAVCSCSSFMHIHTRAHMHMHPCACKTSTSLGS